MRTFCRPGRSLAHLSERAEQFVSQETEVAFYPSRSSNQHMVRAGDPMIGQDFAGERSEAALHAIANDGPTDLLGNRIADPHRALPIVAITYQEHETGHGGAPAGVRCQKIGAFAENRERFYALSFLRPRARRAFSTLRPPTVAIRARNPCRRLRTRLLGWKVRFIAHAFKSK